jgi:L-fucose mutarotase
MPLDRFVPAPVTRMLTVSNPAIIPAIVPRLQSVLDAAEGRHVAMQALERFDFYAAAKRAFAIIRTADSGPYGCFILKKGVVDLPPL